MRILRAFRPTLIKSALGVSAATLAATLLYSNKTVKLEKQPKTTDSCSGCGPGYPTPLEAMKNGPREKLLYVPCIQPTKNGKPDYLATIDVDPASPTYSKVIHRLPLGVGEEPHHTGWNSCSSCHGDPKASRKYLVVPCIATSNVYVVDTATDPRAPKLYKKVSGKEIQEKTGLTFPHTTHCLADGNLMISFMGDLQGNAKCGFLLLNKDFEVVGRWEKGSKIPPFNYDFWYQPKHNVMVSSSWGNPNLLQNGFNPAHVGEGKFGQKLYFWDWAKRVLLQEVDLGAGSIPLEVRFAHDPNSLHGFVGAALSSSVHHYYRGPKDANDQWKCDKVIEVAPKPVSGWALPAMPGLITDILLSLDDKYLYFSNWLHGDIRQYDISDPARPRLTGQAFVGGSLRKEYGVAIQGGEALPVVPDVQGVRLQGGPQMLQLSLDGKRLYVTNSLYSPWDKQFYPSMAQRGSQLLQLDVNHEKGGVSVNPKFLVDFGAEPDGPVLAHEIRYPGGDCSSDIWLAK